jgi:uncharacterized membrane protein YjjB (DUF3815 family)
MPDYLKIILLLLSWIAIAVACHVYIKRYYMASLAGAIAIMGYIELGYLDPLWFVGTVSSFFMGSLVALIVGLPFRLVRNLDKEPPE